MFNSHALKQSLVPQVVFLLAGIAAATQIWRDPSELARKRVPGLLFSLLLACLARPLLKLRRGVRTIRSKLHSGSLALLLLGVCAPAAATLGEDVSSVQVDQTRMEAALGITDAARFSLHLMSLPSGTVVKEYVSPAGMVFAVSWQGPTLPDLRQVLGRHFEAYAAAVRSQDSGPGARRIEASGLVVQSGGHMRAFFGRAYLRQMLPRDVRPEEIR